MSALGPTVFRTSDPQVLAAWDAMVTATKAHNAAVRALLADLGLPENHGTYIRNHRPGQKVDGFAIPEAGLPAGWRADGKMMVPRLSTKIGKAVSAKMAALGVCPDGASVVKDFGMPAQAFVGLSLLSCGVAREGDTIWVSWALDPRPGEGNENGVNGFDLTIWEHVPLSVYAWMVEDGNDPWATS